MVQRILISLFLTLCTSIMSSQELAGFKWKKRLVVIADTAYEDASSCPQIALFKESFEKTEDRDILVLFYNGKTLKDTEGFYESLVLPEGFFRTNSELVLLGKDGYVKYRSPLPVEPREIYMIIDQMPMRQSEIRNKPN
ncbi:DUF4174 domain-containing protein [Eudoraea chungangensis]|uniref:DUF4174 domain-containing protein n=1 Tax=Eudoraea chungangensis TaxID=1481905 RepID=UPI0023ECB421|nr:DUF4174 domain-containing protein [Eudoraea chungangensis]